MSSCLIFSDESGCGEDRYEAIGTLSGLSGAIGNLRTELQEILNTNRLSDCEYKDIRGGHKLKVATAYLDILNKYVLSSQIKVMVLVWDKQDSRHKVSRRDDIANTSIMYYRALKSTKRQWKDITIDSEFYPDELTKLDFNQIMGFIERTKIRDQAQFNTLFGKEFISTFPVITSHQECQSKNEPIIQLIDIITGLVRISYEDDVKYNNWLLNESGQIDLFSNQEQEFTTPGKTAKYQLLSRFDGLLKGNSLQVARRSTNGFHSHRPSCGYFFWKYNPQHINDRAPQLA